MRRQPKLSDLGFKPEDIPDVFLRYQQEWAKENAGVALYTKSRRIGISWADSGRSTLDAAAAKGTDTYYMGYEKNMARGYIEDAADWAKSLSIICSELEEAEEIFRDGDEDKSITIFRIVFNSEFKIEALASTPRSLRSRQGNVVIDEAAFHDDFLGVLAAANALSIWGGQIRIITTYNGVDEPYHDLEKQVLAGKLPYTRHFTTFDDALADGLYKRICLVKGQKWSLEAQIEWREQIIAQSVSPDQELFCIPDGGSGFYFSRTLLENCMSNKIPVFTLEYKDDFALLNDEIRERDCEEWLVQNLAPLLEELNPDLRTCFGMDFGRSGDLSYFLPFQMQRNLVRRAPFALEMRNTPYKQQEQVLYFICDRLPRLQSGAMDNRGNGNYLAERAMQKYGSHRIHRIDFYERWYAENFPRYKAALEDKNAMLPADENLIQDHRDVVLVKGVPRVKEKRSQDINAKGKQRHGDGAIAGVLAWFASCQDGSELFPPDFGLNGENGATNTLEDLGWFS